MTQFLNEKIDFGNVRENELLLLTANGVINSNKLVMGGGFAKVVKEYFPGLDYRLAQEIYNCYDFTKDNVYSYRLAIVELSLDYISVKCFSIGAFQTKLHFADKSSLELIDTSFKLLKKLAPYYTKIHLNMPGVGLGQLPFDSVKKIIPELDNLIIYYL